jgi:hypothetical protein
MLRHADSHMGQGCAAASSALGLAALGLSDAVRRGMQLQTPIMLIKRCRGALQWLLKAKSRAAPHLQGVPMSLAQSGPLQLTEMRMPSQQYQHSVLWNASCVVVN